MNKALRHLLFLVAPLLVWQIIELFILPMNFFTFRAWETLSVTNLHMSGPFYPNQDLTMNSGGDQIKERKKMVRFVTDKYGFRNRPEVAEIKQYDVVVIGDSNIVGSHIDQEKTLAEVLARECDCSVYNYAYVLPKNIVAFFNDPRFKSHPPKNLIFEIRRGDVHTRGLQDITKCDFTNTSLANSWDAYACQELTWFDFALGSLPAKAQIYIDRFSKQPFFHFVKRKLGIVSTPSFSREAPERKHTEELVNYSFEKIKSYSDEAQRRGINFVFLFYPYFIHDVDSLVPKLENAGIKTIGFLPSKQNQWSQVDYNNWIHQEDSHWLESSIAETANLINSKLQIVGKPATQHEYSSLRSSSQRHPQR